MTKQNENVLTADQLKANGHHLTDIMEDLDTLRDYAKTMTLARLSGVDTTVLISHYGDFISHALRQFDTLFKELDGIAFQLLECDNPSELKAAGVTIENDEQAGE